MRDRQRDLKRFGMLLLLALMAVTVIAQGCDCNNGIPLSIEAEIQSIPKALIFESVPIGNKLTREVIIKNTGRGELKISALSVVNETAGTPFSLLTKKTLPLVIQPGKTVSLRVRYEPKRAGSAKGYIKTISNAKNADAKGVFPIPLRSTELSAVISVVPNPVEFGAVKPGDKVTKTITVRNKGAAVLQIFGAEFEKNIEKEFAIETNLAFPLDIAPGKSVTVKISYTPKKPIADENLILRNNTKASPTYPVRLVSKIAAPAIEIKPLKLVFDTTAVGTKDTKSFVIFNKGTIRLEIKGITLGSGTSQDFDLPNLTTFPLMIEPGKSAKIDVQYISTDTKDDTGTVKVTSNDPNSPELKVELAAKAQGCNLVSVPTQLHFTKGERKQVTIVNQGNRPCTYKGAYFSKTTSKEFSFFLPPPSAQILGPGQKLDFLVKFSAQDAKDDKGEMVVDSDDPDSPQLKIPLSSKLASTNPCELVPKPTILQFGFLSTGRSRQLPVVVTNHGFGDCFVTKLTFSPNPSNVFSTNTKLPPQGQVIPSGSKLTVTVAFTPSRAGSFQGTMVLTSNDSRGKPITIKLVGSSGTLCLEALPNPLDFGSVKVGCSSSRRPLEIFNVCKKTATVTKIAFGKTTNTKSQEFRIKAAPNLPKTIPFGQSMTVQLSYVARDLGPDLGTLEISNNLVGQSPILAGLRGEGVSTDAQKDVFRQLKNPQIDILFDIDDSGSMGNDQSNLARNFQSFIAWASKLKVDYHIGVITTDTRGRGCLRGTVKVVTPNTPNLSSVLAANVRVGTRGSPTERGLETSYLALSSPSLTGCNKGFYRPNASLSIVYVSDEPDYSTRIVNFYINFLRSLKGLRHPDKIRVSAIGPPTTTCQRKGCRYRAVVQALRGIYSHITSTNWGSTLSSLGAVTFGYRSQFFLSRPADSKTIRVKVNGQSVSQGGNNGWTYDATNNSVNFGKGAVPAAGTLIEISYNALCLPP